jgi:PIN domain nuclease of toxin-antitoxin system
LGKISADLEELAEAATETGFSEIPVTVAHTLRLQKLAQVHRDPFDRMLAAQALVEGFTFVTRDSVFERYGVSTMWK